MFVRLAIGGGVMALASAVPWVSASSFGPFQSFVDLTGIDLGAGYLTLVFGLLASILALIGLRGEERSIGTPAVACGWVGLVTYAAFSILPLIRIELQRAGIDTYDYYGRFYHAWGLALGVLGSIITIAAAARIRARQSGTR